MRGRGWRWPSVGLAWRRRCPRRPLVQREQSGDDVDTSCPPDARRSRGATALLPGAPLIVSGALLYVPSPRTSPSLGAGRLAILAALGVLAWARDIVCRRAGRGAPEAAARAVVVALLGMLVGVMCADRPLLGPIIGAIAGDLLAGRKPYASVSGVHRPPSVVHGRVAHFALALVMVALFGWWVAGLR